MAEAKYDKKFNINFAPKDDYPVQKRVSIQSGDVKTATVRMPAALYDDVSELAKQSGESLNLFIINAIHSRLSKMTIAPLPVGETPDDNLVFIPLREEEADRAVNCFGDVEKFKKLMSEEIDKCIESHGVTWADDRLCDVYGESLTQMKKFCEGN